MHCIVIMNNGGGRGVGIDGGGCFISGLVQGDRGWALLLNLLGFILRK